MSIQIESFNPKGSYEPYVLPNEELLCIALGYDGVYEAPISAKQRKQLLARDKKGCFHNVVKRETAYSSMFTEFIPDIILGYIEIQDQPNDWFYGEKYGDKAYVLVAATQTVFTSSGNDLYDKIELVLYGNTKIRSLTDEDDWTNVGVLESFRTWTDTFRYYDFMGKNKLYFDFADNLDCIVSGNEVLCTRLK